MQAAVGKSVSLSEERGKSVGALLQRLELPATASLEEAVGKIVSLSGPGGPVAAERLAGVLRHRVHQPAAADAAGFDFTENVAVEFA